MTTPLLCQLAGAALRQVARAREAFARRSAEEGLADGLVDAMAAPHLLKEVYPGAPIPLSAHVLYNTPWRCLWYSSLLVGF